ncbi:MAG: hypothetical protein HW380_3731 [Magnetococcales bacterium]|nr:hypothetical protein [Magnetococcales bacterium]HIJ83824.1 hypothetical protein [Magnetococcales bacterium]
MGTWRLVVFLSGISIFLALQLSVLLTPMIERDYFPIETDDSLAYTQRAKQFEECFRQDCKALLDLRKQHAQSPDSSPERITAKERLLADSIAIYGPLHSALQSGLKSLGFSWTSAYNILHLATLILLVVGFAYWTSGLFGIEVSGLTLALLGGLVVYRLMGVDALIPSFLSTGIALFTWGLLLRFQRRLGYWLLPLVLLMLSAHMMVGFFLGGITLAAFWLLDGWRLKGRDLGVFLTGGFLVLADYLLQHWVDHPKLGGSVVPVSMLSPEYWPLLKANLASILVQFRDWMGLTGGKFETLAVLILAIVLLPKGKKKPFVLFFVLISLLCLVSALVVYAHLSGPVFSRFFLIWAGLMTGAVSYLAWRCGQVVISWFFSLRRSPKGHSEDTGDFHWRYVTVIGSILILSILCFNAVTIFSEALKVIPKQRSYKLKRFNYSFDENQVSLLLEGPLPCHRVLYGHREVMGAFFVMGSMRCGALFANILPVDNAEKKQWILSHQVSHFVFRNPAVPNVGKLLLDQAQIHLRYLNGEPTAEEIRFYFKNGAEASTIVLQGQDSTGVETILERFELPAHGSGWMTSKAAAIFSSVDMTLIQEKGKATALLGIRLGQDEKDLLWPWQQGLELSFLDRLRDDRPGTVKKTRFDIGAEYNLPGVSEVIADRGFSALATMEF